MKLVNLIPLKEIDFRNQDAFDAYIKKHDIRPSTKVKIAGKTTTAGQAAQQSKDKAVKGTSVFGKDKGSSVFGGDKKGPKTGDIVVPNKGEHKGQKHKVIHVFDDGSMNIQPVGLKAKDIKYRQGAVKAKPEDIELPTNDFSDIKGPKPGDSGWSTEDVFNATFKDPETGKTITVGDAYDREDGSPAYEKAFAYAAEFNPDDEKLISGPGSGDDFSNIKGPKPDDSGWSTEDVFNATFKDPKTGKTITVGDAYDREDDSEAYNIALDYVSQFNPDDEELISGPGSPSKKTDSNLDISPKNWKTEPNGGMKFAAAMELEKILNSELGVDGAADIGDNSGTIEYVIDDNDRETNLYLGKSKDGYDVSIANPYSDEFEEPKVFKTPEEAVKYAIELAKKYKKDLGAKNESVKLKSLLPKRK